MILSLKWFIIVSMTELPRWNMETIYPSADSEEFSSDIERVKETASLLQKKAEDPSVSIKELIDIRDRGASLLINVSAYAEALLSTDSDNSVFLRAVSRAEDAAVIFRMAEDSFTRASASRAEEFSHPELRMYGKYLEEIKCEAEHMMSPEEEALAAELARSGSSAWERLMASITSTAYEGGLTLTELRAKASDPDRAVRKDAYERELRLLDVHKAAIAGSLNGVKGTVLTLEKRRGWNDPLDRSLFMSSIDREILGSLLESIKDSLPSFRRYFRTKASLLGVEKMDFYDLFAPVGRSRSYTFQEAREIVLSSFSSFSGEMGDFARHAFDAGWIDAEPRKGKAGGAYDIFFPEAGESRIFCNFDGSYDSVAAIAHELGHAYHDSIVRDLPPSLSSYPMTTAETASIFSEMLVFDHVLSSAGDEEALSVMEAFVQSAAQTIVDIYSRYLFEKEVFRRRKEGEISADELSAIMLSAQEEAYGDGIGKKHGLMWAVKSHYYSAEFSFYNYPYAFGELFALALFSKRNEKGFPELYREVLRSTGMRSAEECARIAVCDIRERNFWDDGMNVIFSYSERLEKWL